MRREVHVGKVLDLADPDKSGGAKLQVNDLIDGSALDDVDYVPGRYPFAGGGEGFYYAPQKGSLLELEVEADEERAAEELAARWVGMLYTDQDAIPTEFSSDAQNRGGIKFGSEVFLQDKKLARTALISAAVRLGEEAASHPLMRGDTFNTQLETFLTALDVYLTAENTYTGQVGAYHTAEKAIWTAWKALSPGLPVLTDALIAVGGALENPAQTAAAGATTYQGAVATFKAAVAAFKAAKTSWLSTKCKTE